MTDIMERLLELLNKAPMSHWETIREAAAEIKRLREQHKYFGKLASEHRDELETKIGRLQAELAMKRLQWEEPEVILVGPDQARNAALEEAAQVAKSYEPRCDSCPRGVVEAIRFLKEEK